LARSFTGAVLDAPSAAAPEAGDAIVPIRGASRALRSAIARKTAMMNAVELLILEARGRSLAIEMPHPGGAGVWTTRRDDRRRVAVPVRGAADRATARLPGPVHVDHRDHEPSRGDRHHERARRRRQAAPSGVIGVFAEHLDAARHPVAPRWAVDAAGIEHGPRGRQQARLAPASSGLRPAAASCRAGASWIENHARQRSSTAAMRRAGTGQDAVLGNDHVEATPSAISA
jgi:hypothetical protein